MELGILYFNCQLYVNFPITVILGVQRDRKHRYFRNSDIVNMLPVDILPPIDLCKVSTTSNVSNKSWLNVKLVMILNYFPIVSEKPPRSDIAPDSASIHTLLKGIVNVTKCSFKNLRFILRITICTFALKQVCLLNKNLLIKLVWKKSSNYIFCLD